MIAARDLHKSLKSEVLAKANAAGAELVLVKLAWGNDDVAFSLHVAPNSWSTSGLQVPDLLSYIGFSRQPCLFLRNVLFESLTRISTLMHSDSRSARPTKNSLNPSVS